MGEPVEVDGITFLVQQLAAVRSLPGSNGQPLIAEAGNRLWLLTVSVRNDSQAVEADPFCRGERGRIRLGADLWTRQGWIHNWWIKSKLIDGNDQLCGDIQPGSTETHQLLYTVPKNRPAITGVTLGASRPWIGRLHLRLRGSTTPLGVSCGQ